MASIYGGGDHRVEGFDEVDLLIDQGDVLRGDVTVQGEDISPSPEQVIGHIFGLEGGKALFGGDPGLDRFEEVLLQIDVFVFDLQSDVEDNPVVIEGVGDGLEEFLAAEGAFLQDLDDLFFGLHLEVGEELLGQIVFAVIVLIERAFGDIGLFDDVIDRNLAERSAFEHPDERIVDAFFRSFCAIGHLLFGKSAFCNLKNGLRKSRIPIYGTILTAFSPISIDSMQKAWKKTN